MAAKDGSTGLRPLSCKSIQNMFVDDSFILPNGEQLQGITIVGTILEADSNSQRFDYVIGDHTGATLSVKEYVDMEDEVEPPQMIQVGSYVRVYGNLKAFQGAPSVMANRIYELKDPNELTTHLLETAMSCYSMNKPAGDSSVDPTADLNTQVHTVIKSCKSSTGMSVSEIKAALPNVSSVDVMKAVNHLSGEGYIFSTIDEDHYKSTEEGA